MILLEGMEQELIKQLKILNANLEKQNAQQERERREKLKREEDNRVKDVFLKCWLRK